MILLHGFPEFWFSWRFMMPELSKHFHLVVPDQRGYNLSDKPYSVKKYYLKALADDVHEILRIEAYDYYHKKCGFEEKIDMILNPKAIIVGHDWGGGLSWQIARWMPDIVAHLVIINCPPPDLLLEETMKNVNQLLKSYYVFMFQIPIVAEHFFKILKKGIFNMISKVAKTEKENRHVEKKAYIKAFSYERSASGINWYRGAMRYAIFEMIGKKPMYTSTRKIKCPTKVIWGTADQALDVNLVRNFDKVVEKSKLSIVLLPGISHWAPQEAPEAIVSEMLKFIQNRNI
jgi:pimeloyl-ACP methyl ester carboxylesterase